MARYTGPRVKKARRYGAPIFANAAVLRMRRTGPPGPRPQRRRKVSDRGLQLNEKQKVRYAYGLMEKQFRRYYERAVRHPGVTGDQLMIALERRLDNVVFRLGLAGTRAQARQLVTHGLIAVNGRKAGHPQRRDLDRRRGRVQPPRQALQVPRDRAPGDPGPRNAGLARGRSRAARGARRHAARRGGTTSPTSIPTRSSSTTHADGASVPLPREPQRGAHWRLNCKPPCSAWRSPRTATPGS